MSARSLSASLVAILLAGSVLVAGQAHETVLYSFGANPNDGNIPNGGLVFDSAGNLYGTTQRGGANNGGTAFELTSLSGGGWAETVIYNFCSQSNCTDGGGPLAGLVFDDVGNLYGTTASGGTYTNSHCGGGGCGTVFELSPPLAFGGPWVETVLWDFKGDLNGGDGDLPAGRLTWDVTGNLYGTTQHGGNSSSLGTVFELTVGLNGTWTEDQLYVFCAGGPPCPDGAFPSAGVSFDKSGNLYGTTYEGALDGKWGTVYRLAPQGDGTWSETTLHRFTAQAGGQPLSTVNFDASGNLYGTVSTGQHGGPAQCGGVWKLTPEGNGFKEGVSLFTPSGSNGCTPVTGVFMDVKANTVIGTTSIGGAFNAGTVFKITGTKQKVVYNFCQLAGCADGSTPSGSFTTNGKALYSTTAKGGTFNQGVVFAITP